MQVSLQPIIESWATNAVANPLEDEVVKIICAMAVQIFSNRQVFDIKPILTTLDKIPISQVQRTGLYMAWEGVSTETPLIKKWVEHETPFAYFSESYTLVFNNGQLVVTQAELFHYGVYFECLIRSTMQESIDRIIQLTQYKLEDFEVIINILKDLKIIDFNDPYTWHIVAEMADRFILPSLINELPPNPIYSSFDQALTFAKRCNKSELDVTSITSSMAENDIERARESGLQNLIVRSIRIPIQKPMACVNSLVLKSLLSKITVIDQQFWQKHVDLAKYGLSFTGVPSITNCVTLQSLIQIFARVKVWKRMGFTLLAIPTEMTLNKLLQIASDNNFHKLKFRKVLRKYGDRPIRSGVIAITNEIVMKSEYVEEDELGEFLRKKKCRTPKLLEVGILSYFSYLQGKKLPFVQIPTLIAELRHKNFQCFSEDSLYQYDDVGTVGVAAVYEFSLRYKKMGF